MGEDLKPEMLKTTQTLLAKYIKKPPLTDKLLKKPPFRYLHDIVTSIIKETAFLKGLYTPEEMVADNIADKAAKVAFLDKLIAAVKLTTGANLMVKSSKIVSGLEVSRTHELLQAIGEALENKVDSKNAVEEILNKKGSRKSAKDSSKSKNKDDISKRKSSNDRVKEENINIPSPRKVMDLSNKTSDISPSSSAKENIQNNKQETPKPQEVDAKYPTAEDETMIENKAKRKEENNAKETKVNTEKVDQERVVDDGTINGTNSVQDEQNKEKSPREESRVNSSPRKTSPRDKKSPRGDKKSPREKSLKDETTPRDEKKTPPDKKSSQDRRKHSPSMDAKKSEDGKTDVRKSDSDVTKAVKSPQNTATVKDKRNGAIYGTERVGETTKDRTERNQKDSQNQKDSPGNVRTERNQKESPVKDRSGKKDSRPSSARPGSRKPLKATPGSSATSNPVPATGVPKSVRPGSALKRPPSAGPRPPSARPGAPRVKDRGEIASEEPVSVMGPVNLIRETGREEDEEVEIVEVEVDNERKPSLTTDDQENQGQLVNQILETQKEFEDGLEPEVLRRTQIEWEGARKKGREATGRDIERLKDHIQTLTRSALPLGKLMSFYQEDAEEIERELTTWKMRSEELRKQLKAEMEKTSQSIEPLKLQLEELESKIVEENEQVLLMKMKIYKNDQRIQQLLKTSRGLSGR